MKKIDSIFLSGKEVLPLVEGGKGIAVSSGESSGAWAKAGGVGTFSGVNADSYDKNGNLILQVYKGKTRSKRHRELVDFSVSGAIEQAKIARDIAGDKAPIHINILWEMAAAEVQVLWDHDEADLVVARVGEGVRGVVGRSHHPLHASGVLHT